MAKTVSKRRKKAKGLNPIVSFQFEDQSYQIDPERRQVYRNWVSVESAKTFLVMNAWSNIDH